MEVMANTMARIAARSATAHTREGHTLAVATVDRWLVLTLGESVGIATTDSGTQAAVELASLVAAQLSSEPSTVSTSAASLQARNDPHSRSRDHTLRARHANSCRSSRTGNRWAAELHADFSSESNRANARRGPAASTKRSRRTTRRFPQRERSIET